MTAPSKTSCVALSRTSRLAGLRPPASSPRGAAMALHTAPLVETRPRPRTTILDRRASRARMKSLSELPAEGIVVHKVDPKPQALGVHQVEGVAMGQFDVSGNFGHEGLITVFHQSGLSDCPCGTRRSLRGPLVAGFRCKPIKDCLQEIFVLEKLSGRRRWNASKSTVSSIIGR